MMETLEDPDDGYGTNYRSSSISKHGIPHTIYAFMNVMPQKERFLIIFI